MIRDFFDGFTSYFSAFGIISKLRLWKFFLVPILISILLATGLGAAIWTLSGALATWLLPWLSWIPYIPVESTAGWVLNILFGVIGFILFKHLVIAAVSPFMTPLAQKVEEHITGNHTKYSGFNAGQAVKDFFRGLTIALGNILRELFYIIPLLILGLFPLFTIPCAVLIFLIQAYYAGFGNLAYTLEGHYSIRESKRFVKNNRWLAIGNGTAFLMLLGTGIGFLVAPPLAAVAGASETIKRIEPMSMQLDSNFDEEYV